MDKKRLKRGTPPGRVNFERLLSEIREIRLSERHLYQKITDIYATSVDYRKSPRTSKFFSVVQNKLHHAIHGHTAPELIRKRADSTKPHMGLTSWKSAPGGKIAKTDVATAKNYLTAKELGKMGLLVNAYLDLAEDRAKRKIAMKMKDWVTRLDKFLKLYGHGVLQNPGSISADRAKDHATSEFEKYRIVQDRLFESDFDKEIKVIEQQIAKKKHRRDDA